jgi:molybdate transport system substrate-binding protein
MSTAIAGISSMATRVILGDLARRYEAASGTPVAIRSMGGVDAAKLIRAGEETDIVILASGPMGQLEAEGHLLAGSVKPFARSGMAIAVKAGTPWPDIGSEEAVRQAIAAARKVGYSTGPSGDHLLQLCARWGLDDPDRMLKAPPGIPVGALVAQGEADLGFQQLSELLMPGIEVVGPLPPEIQAVTVFAAGVARSSQRATDTQVLIAYLIGPDADAVKRAHGMEPA